MKKLTVIIVLAGFIIIISAFTRTPEKPKDVAALGRLLFFDPLLSSSGLISCASCHKEQFAFADTSATSLGVFGRKGKRNTPSAMNVTLQANFFWDGRAITLEDQALIPIENPDEMNMPVQKALDRLQKNPFYRTAFQRLFNSAPSKTNLAKALAVFQRTLDTSDSPFDDWRLNDNEEAVSAAAKRGFAVFNDKGKCVKCHFGADFNNTEFRNIGLYDGRNHADSGRAAITKKSADLGKFKIGPLRNIAITAPYMHNGQFKTLAEVIDFYDDPVKVVPGSINRDSLLLKPLGLTNQEKGDLEAFLISLTDRRFLQSKKP